MFLRAGGRRMRGEFEDLEGESRDFAVPAGVTVLRDLRYGLQAAQSLDVYLPAGISKDSKAPVLFMVHGGAWMAGDKATSRVVENKVAHWVARGYALVSVNYRLLPDADPVKQADDVATALAFTQGNLASWGGDATSMLLVGHSSGAHLLALLASDPGIAKAHGVAPWLGTVMLDSASMNIVSTMNAPHRPLYDRVFGRSPEYWRAASPFHRLSGRPAAPMMMVCSSLREDSCPQAQAFAEKVRSTGGRVEVLPVRLAHAEINAALGLEGPYTAAVDSFIRSLGLP